VLDALEVVAVWFVILGIMFGTLWAEQLRKHPPLKK